MISRVTRPAVAVLLGAAVLTSCAPSRSPAGGSGVSQFVIVARPAGPVTTATRQPAPKPTLPKLPPDRLSVPGERRYVWTDDDSSPFTIGATVAVVRGLSPRGVLRALAPDAATAIEAPAAVERWASRGGYSVLRSAIDARPLGGGWTLVVNVLGFRATEHHFLRALSAGGTAVVVYEDVNATSDFQVAHRGRIVRDFDPLLYDRPWIGHPSRAERRIRFADRRDFATMAKCMLLTARLTGVALTLADVNSQSGIAVGVRD